MCHPIPSLGIPTLDPYENDTIPFYLTEERFGHLEGNLWKLKITNLSSFVINKIELSLSLKIDANITVPEIHVVSAYRVKGILSHIFPIDGAGLLNVKIYNASIALQAKIKGDEDGNITLDSFKITPKVGGFNGTLDRITPSDNINKFFDRVLNEKGSEVVDSIWHDYETKATQYILDLSTEFTKGLKVENITGNDPIFPETDPPPNCKIPPVL